MNKHVTTAPPLDTFRSLTEVHFMHTIFHFKYWEVRSPQLQMVLDLELKRRSYDRLKMTVHTVSGNIAATPHFATVGHVFGELYGA